MGVQGDDVVTPNTIGEALVARREALGLDKGRAASRIGMSRTSYGAYERDAQRPSIEVFAPLIDFLQIPLEEFLTLYGATCIALARTSFGEASSEDGDRLDGKDGEDTPGSDTSGPTTEEREATIGDDVNGPVPSPESVAAPSETTRIETRPKQKKNKKNKKKKRH